MNLLSSFSNFYSNLSSDGIFFFWIVIFLFCFLIFLSIVLAFKNKKLNALLKETRTISSQIPNPSVLEVPESKEESKQALEITREQEEKEKNSEIEKKEEIKKSKNIEETGPYSKNVLRNMNTRMQTSPIHIDRKEENSKVYDNNSTYLKEKTISPLEELEDVYELNDNMKFASDIVNKMEEEIKPSNIELTDYEKKQEEEAIISYDELLKVKDKIYSITEDEETDEFIDELKSFRLDL